eukprot:m.48474 g.48474  ORF g.48474 m.48474 type:complete len:355 (+) comp13290_c0_seq2:282-1346(+)
MAAPKRGIRFKPKRNRNTASLSLNVDPMVRPTTFFDKLQEREGLGQCTVDQQSYSCKPDAFEPGQDIVGTGQYGVVYKVQHIPSATCMAMKEVTVATADPKSHEHLLNDLDVVRTAKHDNIVKFFGYDYHKDALRIMLECALTDWRKIVDKACETDVQVPEPILVSFAHSVTSGLVYLQQELHTMHRDIKPSNVLLASCGRIKLCDFGICKVAAEESHLFNVKSVVGCNIYLPPERINGAGAYDSRSDVWSLGVTLLQLTTLADFPFPESSPECQWQLMQFLKEDPRLIEDIPERIAGPMRAYIASCLTFDCDARPQVTPQLLDHECFNEDGDGTQQATPEEVLSWYQTLYSSN